MKATPLRAISSDPLRTTLAAALKEAAVAQRGVEQQRGGIERARAAVRAAEAAVKSAEKGVEEARQVHARAIADAATADAPPPASGVRAARQAVTDAQDELEAAKGALDQLKADLPGWEEAARTADVAVEAAISEILAPHAQALLAKVQELSRQLSPLRSALRALFETAPARADEYFAWDQGRRPLSAVLEAARSYFETANHIAGCADPWRAARELLRADAFAELPDFAAPAGPSDEAAQQTRAG
jgi:chromosome segregation ATPase